MAVFFQCPEELVNIPRLVLVPILVSIAITVLRVVGELNHWSERWFSTATGGFVPGGMSWLFGITWLALPFGVYFAWRLLRAGRRPASKTALLSTVLLGVAIMLSGRWIIQQVPLDFPAILIPIWALMATAGAIQYLGWPELFQALIMYGLGSRAVTVVVYFVAMLDNWGTHYDYVGMPPQFQMAFLPRFLWLAFFPQLIFWVGFTVAIGTIAGAATALVVGNRVRGVEEDA
jgi:hypothetical protein